MMNEEELLQYISEHEPTKLDKCPDSGRWERREWNFGQTTIIETYIYEHAPTHHQSFKVKNVDRKEVSNG